MLLNGELLAALEGGTEGFCTGEGLSVPWHYCYCSCPCINGIMAYPSCRLSRGVKQLQLQREGTVRLRAEALESSEL